MRPLINFNMNISNRLLSCKSFLGIWLYPITIYDIVLWGITEASNLSNIQTIYYTILYTNSSINLSPYGQNFSKIKIMNVLELCYSLKLIK